MKNLFKISLLSIATMMFSGCGSNDGGSGSSTDNNNAVTTTSSTVEVPSSSQIQIPATANSLDVATDSSGNSCFAIAATPNNKGYSSTVNSGQYYSTATATFTVQNNCSTAQSYSGLTVNINSMTINGAAASVNNIDQAGNPYITLSYSQSGTNLTLLLSTPACNTCWWLKYIYNQYLCKRGN